MTLKYREATLQMEVVAGTSTGHVVISQLTSKKNQTPISLPLYDPVVTANYPPN